MQQGLPSSERNHACENISIRIDTATPATVDKICCTDGAPHLAQDSLSQVNDIIAAVLISGAESWGYRNGKSEMDDAIRDQGFDGDTYIVAWSTGISDSALLAPLDKTAITAQHMSGLCKLLNWECFIIEVKALSARSFPYSKSRSACFAPVTSQPPL